MSTQSRAEGRVGAGPASAADALPGDNLLTVSEAAGVLRVSRRTIERLVAQGTLPFIALPLQRGGLRFWRHELETFLEQRHREALGKPTVMRSRSRSQ
jgi:excisionase family DNA binding protein